LDGFTIQNGKGAGSLGGGIQIDGSPTIRHNRIVNNVGCAGGVGISISSDSPIIQGNFISNNVTQGCSASGGVGIRSIRQVRLKFSMSSFRITQPSSEHTVAVSWLGLPDPIFDSRQYHHRQLECTVGRWNRDFGRLCVTSPRT
jgi:hypothetical protein